MVAPGLVTCPENLYLEPLPLAENDMGCVMTRSIWPASVYRSLP